MRLLAVSAALCLASLGCSSPPAELHVDGNHLADPSGRKVVLHGVDCASLEYTSDGEHHILNTVDLAIREWRAKLIRLPLCQDRWFGWMPEQHGDPGPYRDLVRQVVGRANSLGAYVLLDLHWSDCGARAQDVGQHCMPDANSLAFWTDLAGAFANRPGVMFDLYNEPYGVDWKVWRDGGMVDERSTTTKNQRRTYRTPGMQPLLNAIRAAGAKNIVVAGGLFWASDLSGIAAGSALEDPTGDGVVYADHEYEDKHEAVDHWAARMEAFSKTYPLIVSEFGDQTAKVADEAPTPFTDQVVAALEAHDWNWTAWDMHPLAGPSLIKNYEGLPTAYGLLIKAALWRGAP